MSGDARGFWIFDQETGNVFRYDVIAGRPKRRFIGAVSEPGQPLSQTQAEYNPAEIPRSQRMALAWKCIEDLRMISTAVDQFAIENNHPPGTVVSTTDLIPYLPRASRIRYFMERGRCQDQLGNFIKIPNVDGLPALSQETFDYFSSVVPVDFWIPFPIGWEIPTAQAK